MKLKELLDKKSNNIYKIEDDKVVVDAIQLFNKHSIGSLLVIDKEHNLIGILTEKDILYKCHERDIHDNRNTKVSEIMTTLDKVIIGAADDTILYAMQVMTNKRIRHLPIMSKNDILGVLSIGDIIKTVMEQSETEVKLLREYVKNPYGINL